MAADELNVSEILDKFEETQLERKSIVPTTIEHLNFDIKVDLQQKAPSRAAQKPQSALPRARSLKNRAISNQ